jgi:putative transposase
MTPAIGGVADGRAEECILVVPSSQGEAAKKLETVVLRHELSAVRRQSKQPRFRTSGRAFLAAAARRLPLTRWEGFVVISKTLQRAGMGGRPREAGSIQQASQGRSPLPAEVGELIVRLAREPPRWGYKRVQGELLELGIKVSATTIRKLLSPPRPRTRFPAGNRAPNLSQSQSLGVTSRQARPGLDRS